ncbi:MAG: S24/S26 family peptidase [Candidatus Omnitrophica bacterium]|nr:S24/S26 family peptidase [Candidatus Omnitrophota bacterium]
MPQQNCFKFAFGSSMLPFVKPADLAGIQPAEIKEIKKGDLIIFLADEFNGGLLLHRVVFKERNSSFVMAKGDNAIAKPQRVHPAFLKGKVVSLKRGPKVYNLQSARTKCLYFIIASLSSFNLLPNQVKKIFFDPFLRYLAKKSGFIFSIRAALYSKISFFVFRLDSFGPFQNAWRIQALLKGVSCGYADIFFGCLDGEKSGLIMNFYIRRLDRNNFLAQKLLLRSYEMLLQNGPCNVYAAIDQEYVRVLPLIQEGGFEKIERMNWINDYFMLDASTMFFRKEL